jgi:GT2 family glycosyltransferase
LPHPKVTVAIPTLAEDDTLADCLRSLESQTLKDFEVVVIDNSGVNRARAAGPRVRMIANSSNVGFGAAVNQAFRASEAPYLATLNDDAVAEPHWLELLLACAGANPQAGMFASEVHLYQSGRLDSAGMLIAIDGSSKQRGHGEDPSAYAQARETLFPSGSAAMYRRAMLEEIGGFDESYFLYCEDTDLGLRARWAGWECLYVPGATVQHRYSHSAGRASRLKAYYVERNRLRTVIKNFPWRMLIWVKAASIVRYFWHAVTLFGGKGKAAEFRQAGHSIGWLPLLLLRAYAAAIVHLPRLIADRRRIRKTRRLDVRQFQQLLARHSISLRRVAEL